MKKSILLLFIFTLFTSPVWSFDVDSAIGVGYELNPIDNLSFDSSKVKGVPKQVLENLRYSDIVTGEARKNNYAEYLAVPPGSEIFFYLFGKNNTNVSQTIYNIDLYLSRSNRISGDLTRIGAQGEHKTISYQIAGILKNRTGFVRSFGMDLMLEPEIDYLAMPLYSFKILPPLALGELSYQIVSEGVELKIQYSVSVQNNSEYELCDLQIPEFEMIFCLAPYSSSTYIYHQDIDSELLLSKVTLIDPNRHYEATTSQLLSVQDSNPEGNPAVVTSTVGTWPSKGEEIKNLTIELLPYKLISNEINVDLEPKLQVVVKYDWSDTKYSNVMIDLNLYNAGYTRFNSIVLIEYSNQIKSLTVPILESNSELKNLFEFKYIPNGTLRVVLVSDQVEIELFSTLVKLENIPPIQTEITTNKQAGYFVKLKTNTILSQSKMKQNLEESITKLNEVEGVMESNLVPDIASKPNLNLIMYIFIGVALAIIVWIFIRLW